jgi:CheY-like chemotaxis protein
VDSGKRSKTVLVIEDDNAIRETVRETLAAEGYDVVAAGNGHVALEMLSNGLTPSVALVDLLMPEMDGITLLAEMQKHPKYREIPTILLSASPSLAAKTADVKADAYLAKPFDIESLFEVVKELTEAPRHREAV